MNLKVFHAAILDGYQRRKDKSVSIRFVTQELTTNEVAEIDRCLDTFGVLYYRGDSELNKEEIAELEYMTALFQEKIIELMGPPAFSNEVNIIKNPNMSMGGYYSEIENLIGESIPKSPFVRDGIRECLNTISFFLAVICGKTRRQIALGVLPMQYPLSGAIA